MDKYAITSEKIAFEPSQLDFSIIKLLMDNSRMTLKDMSKQSGKSMDAIKDHIDKMKRTGAITRFTVHVSPKFFGMPLEVHAYIKFKDVTSETVARIIDLLKKDERVITLISMLGQYDLFVVITGKDIVDLERQKLRLREKFKDVIGVWDEHVASQIHKLEHYNFEA